MQNGNGRGRQSDPWAESNRKVLEIWEKYCAWVHWTATQRVAAADVDDVCQDVCLKLVRLSRRKGDSFRVNTRYMQLLTSHRCADVRRRAHRLGFPVDPAVLDDCDPADLDRAEAALREAKAAVARQAAETAEKELSEREQIRRIVAALDKLKPETAELAKLLYEDELKFPDAYRQLGLPRTKARGLLRRLCGVLRALLGLGRRSANKPEKDDAPPDSPGK